MIAAGLALAFSVLAYAATPPIPEAFWGTAFLMVLGLGCGDIAMAIRARR